MLRNRWWRGLLGSQHGLVVSAVPNINEVTLHRPRLVLLFMNVFERVYHHDT